MTMYAFYAECKLYTRKKEREEVKKNLHLETVNIFQAVCFRVFCYHIHSDSTFIVQTQKIYKFYARKLFILEWIRRCLSNNPKHLIFMHCSLLEKFTPSPFSRHVLLS